MKTIWWTKNEKHLRIEVISQDFLIRLSVAQRGKVSLPVQIVVIYSPLYCKIEEKPVRVLQVVVPCATYRRASCLGDWFPPSFSRQVLIITGVNKLYDCTCSCPGLRCRQGVKPPLPLKLCFLQYPFKTNRWCWEMEGWSVP